MKFKYLGPIDAVDVPELGVTVERGHQVEATGAVAESMSRQPDTWQRVDRPPRRKPAKKAAAKKAAPKPPATPPADKNEE